MNYCWSRDGISREGEGWWWRHDDGGKSRIRWWQGNGDFFNEKEYKNKKRLGYGDKSGTECVVEQLQFGWVA